MTNTTLNNENKNELIKRIVDKFELTEEDYHYFEDIKATYPNDYVEISLSDIREYFGLKD